MTAGYITADELMTALKRPLVQDASKEGGSPEDVVDLKQWHAALDTVAEQAASEVQPTTGWGFARVMSEQTKLALAAAVVTGLLFIGTLPAVVVMLAVLGVLFAPSSQLLLLSCVLPLFPAPEDPRPFLSLARDHDLGVFSEFGCAVSAHVLLLLVCSVVSNWLHRLPGIQHLGDTCALAALTASFCLTSTPPAAAEPLPALVLRLVEQQELRLFTLAFAAGQIADHVSLISSRTVIHPSHALIRSPPTYWCEFALGWLSV